MNTRHIINALKQTNFIQVMTPLGRWKIHNYSQTALKIKYANEDNCYTHSEYNNKNNDQSQDIDELYVYMMGFETVADIKKN